jgi:hypothetical protein
VKAATISISTLADYSVGLKDRQHRHMEIYSHGGLDLASCKVGLADQGGGWPPALLGPPSKGFGLRGPHGQRLTVVILV